MMKTCWMGLGCLLLLAGCGSGSSREEAQAKDAAADSKAGSPPLDDAGKWKGSEAAMVCECAGPSDSRRDDRTVGADAADAEAREDAPATLRLDAFPDSAAAEVFRESLGQDGPRADSILPVDLVVDTRAADLALAAEAGSVKADRAADRADTSSIPPSFPCDNDSDCCIEIDGCMNIAYMYSTARGASPKPEIPPSTGMCTSCIAAAVQVRCMAHQCVGERLSTIYDGPLLSDHCGLVKLPDAGATPYHDLPADAGTTPPKSVWTCGG